MTTIRPIILSIQKTGTRRSETRQRLLKEDPQLAPPHISRDLVTYNTESALSQPNRWGHTMGTGNGAGDRFPCVWYTDTLRQKKDAPFDKHPSFLRMRGEGIQCNTYAHMGG